MVRLTTRLNVALLAAVVGSMAQAKQPDLLSLARQHYNEERYAEAIKVAEEARRVTATAHPAAVILSRAHLERFRQTSQAQDLDDAREALKGVEATRLSPREHVEFLIGLGESIYLDEQSGLDDRFSAAAELFEIALARADAIDSRSRDLLFEWWAVSLTGRRSSVPNPRVTCSTSGSSVVRRKSCRAPMRPRPRRTGSRPARAAPKICNGPGAPRWPGGFAPRRSARGAPSSATISTSSSRK